MSKPVSITDTAKAIKSPIVISPHCPTNLLGKVLMKKLNIAVVPTQEGMRHTDFDETAKSIYYSVDFLAHQDLCEPNTLCNMAKQELINPQAEITSDKLKVTLNVTSELT